LNAHSIRSLAVITSVASTLPSFRGHLISRLVSQGIRVFALAPDFNDQSRLNVEKLGAEPVDIQLDRTGTKPLRDLRHLVALSQQLRRLRPDAVFAYYAKPVIYGSVAAWVAGVPRRVAMVAGMGYVFTDIESGETFARRMLRWTATLMYSIAFRCCDRVLFQNTDDAAYFLDRGVIPSRKVARVNGTGVDLEHFFAAPPVLKPVTFLLAARLLKEKGICEFVEAARQVLRHDPNVRFVLLGASDANPGTLSTEQVTAWVKEGLVEWPGRVDDVRPWLAQASVFVLPSYREGIPRSTQEALAMARPVITTNAVGCRETVRDGVNGFLVRVRDAGALADAMLRFVREPTLVVSMGRASRALAEERFDVHRINDVMLDLLGVSAAGTTTSPLTAY
jgi:glycosyltransferase involved in cell wall biosynthesis